MTMIAAMTWTITLAMITVMVPKIYHAFLVAELLFLDEELELLRDLLAERNEWMLRHLGCGLGAMILIWVVMNAPGLEDPSQVTSATAVYASCSLLFAVLESLLAQKISGLLATVPARVKVQD